MTDYILTSQPINFMNTGSLYRISGDFYVNSGSAEFRGEVTNAAVDSYLHSFNISGQLGQWVEFSSVLTATLGMSGGVLRFAYLSVSDSSDCMFDGIKFEDYRDPALGVLQIYPEWDMKRYTKQNRADHRTKGGKLYSYQWGDYERFEIPLDYVPQSKAAIINSWWQTDALIYLKIYSGGVWEVNTCHLMNTSAPFSKRMKPYTVYRTGDLQLETF